MGVGGLSGEGTEAMALMAEVTDSAAQWQRSSKWRFKQRRRLVWQWQQSGRVGGTASAGESEMGGGGYGMTHKQVAQMLDNASCAHTHEQCPGRLAGSEN